MPIDLVAALVAWLVEVSGNSVIGSLLGSRERALRKAIDVAIKAVADQVNPESRRALERGLYECFSSPPRLPLDVSVSVGEGLRAAIRAQLSLLSQWVNNDTDVAFYRDVGLEPEWLTMRFTDAVIEAIRHVVAAGSLPALAAELTSADIAVRLNALDLKVSTQSVSTPAAVTRTLPHDIATFTGRTSDLAALMRALAHGPGGVIGIYAVERDGRCGQDGVRSVRSTPSRATVPRPPVVRVSARPHPRTTPCPARGCLGSIAARRWRDSPADP